MRKKKGKKLVNDFSYYQKLGFDKIDFWEEKDLTQFLIFDYFNSMENEGYIEGMNILKENLLSSVKRYEKYKFIINFPDVILPKLLKMINEKKGKRIIFEFEDKRYLPIINEVRKYYGLYLMLSGRKERLFAIRNFINYFTISDLFQYVLEYLNKGEIDCLRELVRKIEVKLKFIEPDYIILNSDDSPIERAIILVSKKLNIKTINIQSAMILNTQHILLGNLADYVFVWGEYFKKLYMNRGGKEIRNVYILGYPFPVKKAELKYNSKDFIVYYLGQNLENYNDEYLAIKLNTVKKINEICHKLSLRFFYRPHPRDNKNLLKNKMPEISFTDEGETLAQAIKKGDIFISFNSTSLIEASICSKISLQLLNYPVNTDNFGKLGARIKSFQTIIQLEKYLENLINSDRFIGKARLENKDYFIKTTSNSSQRFVEILKDIDGKNVKL